MSGNKYTFRPLLFAITGLVISLIFWAEAVTAEQSSMPEENIDIIIAVDDVLVRSAPAVQGPAVNAGLAPGLSTLTWILK